MAITRSIEGAGTSYGAAEKTDPDKHTDKK